MNINKQDGYSPILLTSLRHWMENRGTVGFDVIISTARIFLRLTSVAWLTLFVTVDNNSVFCYLNHAIPSPCFSRFAKIRVTMTWTTAFLEEREKKQSSCSSNVPCNATYPAHFHISPFFGLFSPSNDVPRPQFIQTFLTLEKNSSCGQPEAKSKNMGTFYLTICFSACFLFWSKNSHLTIFKVITFSFKRTTKRLSATFLFKK